MNKLSNLIFDIGGVVILQPKPDWNAADTKFSLAIGTFKKIVDDCFKKRSSDKNFNEEKYFEITYSNLLSWKQYQEILQKFFAGESLNEQLLEWIKEKKANGLKVYALTNNTAVLNNILENKFNIKDVFDKIFNSAEIGLTKPDPKFFKHFLDDLSVSSEACLFVDDSAKNTQAAEQLGFTSILFENNKTFFEKTDSLGI